MRLRPLPLAVLALAVFPASAQGDATTGGTAPEHNTYSVPPSTTGGTVYGAAVPRRPAPRPAPRRRPRPRPRPRPTVVERPRFPVVGPHVYTDSFGAARSGGRTHMGQDIAAAEGTPLVAPWKGRVVDAGYGTGAGYYIVIRGSGTGRDYVFYHLRQGSIRVRSGQSVRTGQRIGDVGNTGNSFGAHLHFEIWQGAWFGGGRAIDPLPDLRRWDAYS